jgi:hypothetical protein
METQYQDGDWEIRDWFGVKKQLSREEACIRIQSFWRGVITRKTFKIVKRTMHSILIYQMKMKLPLGTTKHKFFVVSLFKHFQGGEIFYSLRARETSKSKRCHPVVI